MAKSKVCSTSFIPSSNTLTFQLRKSASTELQAKNETSLFPSHELSLETGKTNQHNYLISAYNKYRHLCEIKPLRTKALSQFVIGGVGSLLSQCVLAKAAGNSVIVINWSQVQAFMVSGLLFEGPYFHWWFERLWMLGRWLDKSVSSSVKTTLQVVVDQTVGVLLFFPTYFFVFETIHSLINLKAPNLPLARHRLGTELLSVLRTNYMIWPVTNWIIFRHVPESLRVLATSVVAVLWNAYLCSRVAGT